jgi:two-component system CheB/CheR fusion protein
MKVAQASHPEANTDTKREISSSPQVIVGIGASAGGLEALELFFSTIPEDSGIAFVVVQHLDPKRKGMLTELLQRITQLKVAEVEEGVEVKANCIYVIPPNKGLSLSNGRLYLQETSKQVGQRNTIDGFFCSLAKDLGSRSVGLILSGMGRDGLLGLEAIKEMAGGVFVQDPTTAKYDSMPRSVIDAGFADVVAPPLELGKRLIEYIDKIGSLDASDAQVDNPLFTKVFQKVVALLQIHTGHDFSLYKSGTLHRRVRRRMAINQSADIEAYLRLAKESPQELDLLFKELLIGVTHFFRDPEAWQTLRESALPALISRIAKEKERVVRVWVPACSTGEEAYSMAITLKEVARRLDQPMRMQVFATDLDPDAINQARRGIYNERSLSEVSPALLKRYFIKEKDDYRICKEIRDSFIFATQNLVMDSPFTKMDILSCRNLLIYFSSELQRKVISLFNYSLNPNGLLFLGSSETIGNETPLFDVLYRKERIYTKQSSQGFSEFFDLPIWSPGNYMTSQHEHSLLKTESNVQDLADQIILQLYAPPSVLVNADGDILYISGRTGKYLEPSAGKANWNLFAMAHDNINNELTSLFHQVVNEQQAATITGLAIDPIDKSTALSISIRPMEDSGNHKNLYMVIFVESDVAAYPESPDQDQADSTPNSKMAEMKRELLANRKESKRYREEMHASQQELRSINEEMQSTNEEMQSANEELMTSKEEMQSLNEELQTVNVELESKLNELSQSHDDMTNLLNSTNIATIFLDLKMQVRRYTPEATKIVSLIPGDVGRPLSDLSSDLDLKVILNHARNVLVTLVSVEESIEATDGRKFMLHTLPYRTRDNQIDGVVITLTDIPKSKNLKKQNQSSECLGSVNKVEPK